MTYKNPTTSASAILFVCLLAFICIALLPSCGVKGKSDSPKQAEDFESFYQRFHIDPGFQLSRISFPLEGGLIESTGEQMWTRENWPLMKVPIWEINEPGYKTDYRQTDKEFFQKIWVENSGFISEYRFRLIDGKWFLVYAMEQNL